MQKNPVQLLKKGRVIGFPTDTVYGMGCILSEECVKKLVKLKGKRAKPFAIFLSSPDKVNIYVTEIKPYVKNLMNCFWPGPLTLVFYGNPLLPEGVLSEEKKVGIRIPNNKKIQEWLKDIEKPLIQTSANKSGKPSPLSDIDVKIKLDYLVPGKSSLGEPSTVLDVTGSIPIILREGTIKEQEILKCLEE